ncbi:ATP-binding protein [Treponema vincentii]|uniref:ATP-binding protein n=1 Tax=Treponema vincentii TaxID=69710 RepID=UPI0039BF15C4
MHQDFSVGVPVQISVYKDKLYISNDCIFPVSWTAETLMQKHRSLPHNPDISNTFFRAGFIESWGRGVEKICRLCREYGIAEPEYTVHPNDIMVMFELNEPVKMVLEAISENPNLSKEKIAEKISSKEK